MQKRSKVREIEPAPSNQAQAHFAQKLALETDPADVHSAFAEGNVDFVLLDVRSAQAYAQGHARGAASLPHPEIAPERLADYPADQVFVVYCWGPGCNGADKAAHKLGGLGRPVKMMIGGFEYWTREGYPVDQGA